MTTNSIGVKSSLSSSTLYSGGGLVLVRSASSTNSLCLSVAMRVILIQSVESATRGGGAGKPVLSRFSGHVYGMSPGARCMNPKGVCVPDGARVWRCGYGPGDARRNRQENVDADIASA